MSESPSKLIFDHRNHLKDQAVWSDENGSEYVW